MTTATRSAPHPGLDAPDTSIRANHLGARGTDTIGDKCGYDYGIAVDGPPPARSSPGTASSTSSRWASPSWHIRSRRPRQLGALPARLRGPEGPGASASRSTAPERAGSRATWHARCPAPAIDTPSARGPDPLKDQRPRVVLNRVTYAPSGASPRRRHGQRQGEPSATRAAAASRSFDTTGSRFLRNSSSAVGRRRHPHGYVDLEQRPARQRRPQQRRVRLPRLQQQRQHLDSSNLGAESVGSGCLLATLTRGQTASRGELAPGRRRASRQGLGPGDDRVRSPPS